MKIKIIDNHFSHAKYSTDYQTSDVEWVRDMNVKSDNDDIVIYTDSNLQHTPYGNKKIAWLLESPEITRQSYEYIRNNHHKFDYIFTHNKELLDINDKFKFIPTGGCWIEKEDQIIYNKSKNISIIASSKNMTYGHRLRHEIIGNFKNIDVYGRGYQQIPYKLEALKDYRYSITIENTNCDYYFTEKLIDCFVTGTIPIYWGCPSIGDFFDIEGMIIINNANDLNNIIDTLNDDFYINKMKHIQNNFDLSKEYLISEDHIKKIINII